MMMLLSKPSILKSLHFLLIPFGIYVAAQTGYKIQPESISETSFRELTVNKTRALASTLYHCLFSLLRN